MCLFYSQFFVFHYIQEFNLDLSALVKLLCAEVFNESFNKSGLQSIYFLLLKNPFISPEIPMALVDIYDVAFVSLYFRKDTHIFK